ncbi:hypothetical protein [Rhodoferax sp.]|nr:hypothetical protein [Rhodoferax sp.]MDD2810088.1 hypothetical protein [Rhodoferax sp.]
MYFTHTKIDLSTLQDVIAGLESHPDLSHIGLYDTVVAQVSAPANAA